MAVRLGVYIVALLFFFLFSSTPTLASAPPPSQACMRMPVVPSLRRYACDSSARFPSDVMKKVKRDDGAAMQNDLAPEEYNAREKYLRRRFHSIIL